MKLVFPNGIDLRLFCVRGPISGVLFPTAVVFLLVYVIVMDIALIIYVNKTVLPQLSICFCYASVAIGSWTLTMFLMSCVSDPGVVNTKEDTNSKEAKMKNMWLSYTDF